MRRYLPLLAAPFVLLLLLILQQNRDEADYAALIPAPDTIVWEVGDETTVWLQTNRNDVDLRINSVSLGVGNIERVFPESGSAMTLGRAEGCVTWAVNGLEVGAITGTGNTRSVRIDGAVNRNGTTGALTVHVRTYIQGEDLGENPPLSATTTAANGSNDFTQSFSMSRDTTRVIEASHDDNFPEVYTRRITVHPGDPDSATSDTEAEGILMPMGGGVGIIACSQHDDALLTLHGDEGEELNRYLVDVHTKPTPVPAAPPPDAGYNIRRVCVDATDNYLSGGEFAGGTFDANAFGLEGTIQKVELDDTAPENHYQYFFSYTVSGGGVQLLITDAGASGLGLDADQVYPVRLTATDDTVVVPDDPDTTEIDEEEIGTTAHLDVGVWVDSSTLSPNDDGQCS